MERSEQKYHFRLFGDLGPGLATSKLGIVYPDTDADETRHSLADLSDLFSERLDLLQLLRREEELIDIANEFDRELKQARAQLAEAEKRNSQLTERNSQLTERNSHLTTHYSSRRYKLADAFTDSALQVPGIQRIVRCKPGQ
jgi:hypothetical protein